MRRVSFNEFPIQHNFAHFRKDKQIVWPLLLNTNQPQIYNMEIFGLNFAPISIPFERRLQTFAVLFWITLFLFVGPLITILLVCLLLTSYWWITILYMTWVFFDWKTPSKGGRKSDFLYVRHWSIWQFYRNFFPIELVKTVDLNPNKTYMFGSHPHGLGTVYILRKHL